MSARTQSGKNLRSLSTGRIRYLYDLLRELIRREVKLRYKRSVLGIAWSFINPLAQLLIFSFVFKYVLPLNIPDYPAFLFSGLLAWNWFQASLVAGSGAIVDNRELVKRPGFPSVVLPVVTVSTNLIHFLLALPVLLIFLLLSGLPLSAAVLALPVVIALQFLITVGLVYLLATIQVTFRDTQYLLGLALMLGFYITPILYNLEAVPERFRWIFLLNPVAVLIDSYRAILLRAELPSWGALVFLGFLSILSVVGGYFVFLNAGYKFMEEL